MYFYTMIIFITPIMVVQNQPNKKLVPWGTDGRLPLSGDFRSLILE